jgi:hypothetical protein
MKMIRHKIDCYFDHDNYDESGEKFLLFGEDFV